MKKLLLVATVLIGGVAASQAGLNISIGIGLPRPAIVVRHPVVCPPPVYVAPVCPPRVVVVPARPVHYRPTYWHGGPQRWRGHSSWTRHDSNARGHQHRR